MKTIKVTVETIEENKSVNNSVTEMMRKTALLAIQERDESLKYRTATAEIGIEKIKAFLENFEEEVIPLLKEYIELRKMLKINDNKVYFAVEINHNGWVIGETTWGISLVNPSVTSLSLTHGYKSWDMSKGDKADKKFPYSFVDEKGNPNGGYYCDTSFEVMYGKRGFVNAVDTDMLIVKFKEKILDEFNRLVGKLQSEAKHNKDVFDHIVNNHIKE